MRKEGYFAVLKSATKNNGGVLIWTKEGCHFCLISGSNIFFGSAALHSII